MFTSVAIADTKQLEYWVPGECGGRKKKWSKLLRVHVRQRLCHKGLQDPHWVYSAMMMLGTEEAQAKYYHKKW